MEVNRLKGAWETPRERQTRPSHSSPLVLRKRSTMRENPCDEFPIWLNQVIATVMRQPCRPAPRAVRELVPAVVARTEATPRESAILERRTNALGEVGQNCSTLAQIPHRVHEVARMGEVGLSV